MVGDRSDPSESTETAPNYSTETAPNYSTETAPIYFVESQDTDFKSTTSLTQNADNSSDSGNGSMRDSTPSQCSKVDQEEARDETPLTRLPQEPPALPPRPPNLALPRPVVIPPPHAAPPQQLQTSQQQHHPLRQGCRSGEETCKSWWSVLTRKYVLLSWVSGGLCSTIGVLFLVLHFLVVSRTSSLHYFQTIPAYVPSIMMICTGTLVALFSKGSARYPSLIKITGICCLLSSALCVVVTITTTVIHMNRLQTLRECVYQSSTRTCTCFAGIIDQSSIQHHDATMRYIFTGTSDCEVVHGTLYSCLRGMFGLSVIGILVSIFSCMLVYQILSHERKKRYLEQLDNQCASLYCRPRISRSRSSYCSTDSNCQCNRQQIDYLNYRLWNRRCDNLYTPTPANTTMTTNTAVNTPGSSYMLYTQQQQQQQQPNNRNQITRLPTSTSSNGVGGGGQQQWRNTDDIYGFRSNNTTVPGVESCLGGSRQIMSCYTVTELLSKGMYSANSQMYSGSTVPGQNESLPNLLWGPPPPYSTSPPQNEHQSLVSYIPPGGPMPGNQASAMTGVQSSTVSADDAQEDNNSSRTNPRTSWISRGDSNLSCQGITRVHHIFDDSRNSAVEPISSPVHNRLNNTAISSPVSGATRNQDHRVSGSLLQGTNTSIINCTSSTTTRSDESPEPGLSSILYSHIQDPRGGAGPSSSGYTPLVDLHVGPANIEPKLDKHQPAQTNGLPIVDSTNHKIHSLYGGFSNNCQPSSLSGQSGQYFDRSVPDEGSCKVDKQPGGCQLDTQPGGCQIDKQPALEYLRKKEEDLQHEADLREIRKALESLEKGSVRLNQSRLLEDILMPGREANNSLNQVSCESRLKYYGLSNNNQSTSQQTQPIAQPGMQQIPPELPPRNHFSPIDPPVSPTNGGSTNYGPLTCGVTPLKPPIYGIPAGSTYPVNSPGVNLVSGGLGSTTTIKGRPGSGFRPVLSRSQSSGSLASSNSHQQVYLAGQHHLPPAGYGGRSHKQLNQAPPPPPLSSLPRKPQYKEFGSPLKKPVNIVAPKTIQDKLSTKLLPLTGNIAAITSRPQTSSQPCLAACIPRTANTYSVQSEEPKQRKLKGSSSIEYTCTSQLSALISPTRLHPVNQQHPDILHSSHNMSRSTYTLSSGSSLPGSQPGTQSGSQSTYALPASSSWHNNLHLSKQSSSFSPIHQITSPTLNTNTGQIMNQQVSPSHNTKLSPNHKKLPKVAPKPKCSPQHITGFINSSQVKNPKTNTSLGMLYNSTQPSNQQSNYPAQHTTIPQHHQLHTNTMSDTSPLHHLSPSSANKSPLQQSSPAKLTPCQVLYSSEEVGSTRKTSPECVYLRPEQNIPDSFHTTKFKPISPANGSSGGSGSEHESVGGDFKKHEQGGEEGHRRSGEKEESGASSRKVYTSTDDIVLTLRSVQV